MSKPPLKKRGEPFIYKKKVEIMVTSIMILK